MSKILDLAQSFEQKSKQLANDTEHKLQSEFKRHEQSISEALRLSEQKINADISGQSARLSRLILKSWLTVILTIIMVLSANQSLLWWQGTKIEEQRETISKQEKTLQILNNQTWGITLTVHENEKYIVLPTGFTPRIGWLSNKRQAIKMEKN